MNEAFLRAVDYRAPGADAEFVASLRETGFGVLRNHPIDAELVERIYADWRAFFAGDLPDIDKHDFEFDRATQDGFFSTAISERAKGHVHLDIKEYFHFYRWGRAPEPLRADLEAYFAAASTLAAELLGWVERHVPAAVAAGFTEPPSRMIEGSDKTLLRVLHYPPPTGDEVPAAEWAAPHEDINLLTILPAADAPGLEVLGRDGAWRPVPCDFGHLIVNVGDMLQEATAGWLPSTTHRVVKPAGGVGPLGRMSLPLFLHPRPEVVLSGRHTARSYLAERLAELGVA